MSWLQTWETNLYSWIPFVYKFPLQLLAGNGEVFGTELSKNKVYTICSRAKIAVFTWSGCTARISSRMERVWWRIACWLSVVCELGLLLDGLYVHTYSTGVICKMSSMNIHYTCLISRACSVFQVTYACMSPGSWQITFNISPNRFFRESYSIFYLAMLATASYLSCFVHLNFFFM